MPVELTATEALGLWHRVSLEQVRAEHSPRVTHLTYAVTAR